MMRKYVVYELAMKIFSFEYEKDVLLGIHGQLWMHDRTEVMTDCSFDHK